MLTIVASKITINCAIAMTKSAFQRRGSRVDKFPPTEQGRKRLSPQTEEGDKLESAVVVLRAGNRHVARCPRH